jgi:hypothetical protein
MGFLTEAAEVRAIRAEVQALREAADIAEHAQYESPNEVRTDPGEAFEAARRLCATRIRQRADAIENGLLRQL